MEKKLNLISTVKIYIQFGYVLEIHEPQIIVVFFTIYKVGKGSLELHHYSIVMILILVLLFSYI